MRITIEVLTDENKKAFHAAGWTARYGNHGSATIFTWETGDRGWPPDPRIIDWKATRRD